MGTDLAVPRSYEVESTSRFKQCSTGTDNAPVRRTRKAFAIRAIESSHFVNMFFDKADVEYIRDLPWLGVIYCAIREGDVVKSDYTNANVFEEVGRIEIVEYQLRISNLAKWS